MRTGMLALLVVVASAGCSSATTGGPAARDLITSADMGRVNAMTAYDAVARLQPQWLGSRGPVSMTSLEQSEVSVYVNGVEVGGPENLQNFQVIDVEEMRYYPPGEAGARFGMGHPRGVIDVKLKGLEGAPGSS